MQELPAMTSKTLKFPHRFAEFRTCDKAVLDTRNGPTTKFKIGLDHSRPCIDLLLIEHMNDQRGISI